MRICHPDLTELLLPANILHWLLLKLIRVSVSEINLEPCSCCAWWIPDWFLQFLKKTLQLSALLTYPAGREQIRVANWSSFPQLKTFPLSNRLLLLKSFSCQSRHGSVKPPEVLPGASSWLPAAHSSAGPGAGVAAPGYLPVVSPPLDAEWAFTHPFFFLSLFSWPQLCLPHCVFLLFQAFRRLSSTWAQWPEVSTPSTCSLSCTWSGWSSSASSATSSSSCAATPPWEAPSCPLPCSSTCCWGKTVALWLLQTVGETDRRD